MELIDAVLRRARGYVELETPTGAADACRQLAELLRADFEAAGADSVELLPAGDAGAHVRASFAGSAPDLAPMLVLAHLDTVHPVGTLERLPFHVDGVRAYGPGIYDMKGPLALVLETVAGLRKAGSRPRRPLRVLVTCDEETGSATSRGLIEETADGAFCVLVPEPPLPGGGAKTARKGVAIYRLEAHGRASHAGIAPEQGASAILELARQVVRMQELERPRAGTTINTGVIGGGTAINVVPDHAAADVDVRFADPAEGDRVERALRELEPEDARVRLELSGGVNRPPLVRTEGIAQLYRAVTALANEDGISLPEGATGGGSDGCFTASIGVPTLDGIGLPGDGAHTLHEHVLVSEIAARHRLWTRVLREL